MPWLISVKFLYSLCQNVEFDIKMSLTILTKKTKLSPQIAWSLRIATYTVWLNGYANYHLEIESCQWVGYANGQCLIQLINFEEGVEKLHGDCLKKSLIQALLFGHFLHQNTYELPILHASMRAKRAPCYTKHHLTYFSVVYKSTHINNWTKVGVKFGRWL